MELVDTLTPAELSPKIQSYLENCNHELADELYLAGKAASSRLYYRITGEKMSWIVMQAAEIDQEFDRFIEMSKLFATNGVSVPEVYVVDREYAQMLIQDLGTSTLWDTWKFAQEGSNYIAAIDMLVTLQKNVVVGADEISEPKVFDDAMLRWETDYFFNNYLNVYHSPSEAITEKIKEEFAFLAQRVDGHKKVMMHRDFQSQNIMIMSDHVYLIDYQGARLGSYCYDLASLVWDPYVELNPKVALELAHYYYEIAEVSITFEKFHAHFIEASLQRVMQACGAYCFLSDTKGKSDFKRHLEPGLRTLAVLLKQYDGLHALKELLNIED